MCDTIQSCVSWLSDNKEWLFSGIGVVIISSFVGLTVAAARRFNARINKNSKSMKNLTHASTNDIANHTRFFFKNLSFIPKIQNALIKKRKQQQKQLYAQLHDSTLFFSYRFAEAFPGCRGVVDIDDPKEAVDRLDILLREPISGVVNKNGGTVHLAPVYWFRGYQNQHIDKYNRLIRWHLIRTRNITFDDVYFHKVRRVAALGSDSYWANVVYVETDPVAPSGFYPRSNREWIEKIGFEYEEVGVYKRQLIKREEYDDGAALIKGKPVKTLGKAKLQVRYLSKYNFLIAPQGSPINQNKLDQSFEEILNDILQNKKTIDELASTIDKLPRNRIDYSYME